MKRFISCFVVLFLLFNSFVVSAFAIQNPLAVPNNKVGIHILFPSELSAAAALVNSNGGKWGYVIIPIQSGDKDLVKWQNFMNDAARLHVIPIIRLATEGDYFNTKVWRKPTMADVLDFANFLNSLTWPTKNRYIVVYNEVNRGDEWGGKPSPSEYDAILSYAVDIFKQRSNDFFIISAGMDNGAATTSTSMNEYDFYRAMQADDPGIFDKIDGIASHAYPNPAFSTPPNVIARNSITSFLYEKNLIETFAAKNLPVFITETGWSQDTVGQTTAAAYLSLAFQTTWNTNDVVAVTPFLLQAGAGPFAQFSFLNSNGSPNAVYQALYDLPKTKGQPVVNPPTNVLAASTKNLLPTEAFATAKVNKPFTSNFMKDFTSIVKWLLHVR